MNKKGTPILDFIDGLFTNSEMIIFSIPYLILTSVGTIIKLLVLSLLSIISFNKWIKLKDLWNKKYLKANLGNPWNFVLTVTLLIILIIIL
ncbi:hypothetical protein [Winogradskyella immobilis]|uniref:Uncharacterized protein n=1 Tax=Winogradskyella immobilis TaxID=2816852 RepID=A0ABS8EQW2_9FLAO|nr:hypothetical protein [Winogradskyella immobilis]MCC1485628.1 hypothetical protein [Winogradskyella immobilis]MCG0017720.1 hypothetical protein [Winogradskyella immobilis]